MKGLHTLGITMDADRYRIISKALDEGRISIILENHPSHPSGMIVTSMDEVLDFVKEGGE